LLLRKTSIHINYIIMLIFKQWTSKNIILSKDGYLSNIFSPERKNF